MGVPVTLVSVDCLDGPLPGLIATCRRDGADYQMSLLDSLKTAGLEPPPADSTSSCPTGQTCSSIDGVRSARGPGSPVQSARDRKGAQDRGR